MSVGQGHVFENAYLVIWTSAKLGFTCQSHKLDKCHFKVMDFPGSNCMCYWQVGGGPSTERHSCFSVNLADRF